MVDRVPLPLRLYRLASAVAGLFAPSFLARRLKQGKEHPTRLRERYGESDVARPEGPLVWVHGASVGELLAVIPLIGRIRERDINVLCTSGTMTSASIAEQRLPAGVIHQFVALDAPRFVKRFFNHWRPDLALFVESELWPNLIMTGAARGVPLILVNGRLSERAFNRWRRAPASIAALLRRFDLCLAQSAIYAARLRDLGAPRIATTGNLKLDVPEPPADPEDLAALQSAIGTRTVIAAASTHAGEETALIDAHRRLRSTFPRLLTIIAPRHPERGPGILDIASAAHLSVRLRSRGELPGPATDIYIADTMGELGLVYRVAADCLHGRFAGNPRRAEPDRADQARRRHSARSACLEFRRNLFRARCRARRRAGRRTSAGSRCAWARCSRMPDARAALVAAGRETVDLLGGALDRTVAALEPYLLQIRLEHRNSDA